MAQIRASTLQQKREDVNAALQYAPGFHCVVERWHDCEQLEPMPKEKWVHVDQKLELRHIARNGVPPQEGAVAWSA